MAFCSEFNSPHLLDIINVREEIWFTYFKLLEYMKPQTKLTFLEMMIKKSLENDIYFRT